MKPIVCMACGTRFAIDDLTKADNDALRGQHYYDNFTEELHMLRRVHDYFRRFPSEEARYEKMEDDFLAIRFTSSIKHALTSLRTRLFGERTIAPDDIEVVEYLNHHHVKLEGRMQFVSEKVAQYESDAKSVACPHCQEGYLSVPPDSWDEFTSASNITFYWAGRSSFLPDGKLVMRATGWSSERHWNGDACFAPDHPDYSLWCHLRERFLTTKPECRFISSKQLPAFRQAFQEKQTTYDIPLDNQNYLP